MNYSTQNFPFHSLCITAGLLLAATLSAQPIEITLGRAGQPVISGTNTSNANDSNGVHGAANGTGRNAGVRGTTVSTVDDAAGVLARDGRGTPTVLTGYRSAAVRGETGGGLGVLGISDYTGVEGWGTGTGHVWGVRGVSAATTAAHSAGVYGRADNTTQAAYGVHGRAYSEHQFAAGVLGVNAGEPPRIINVQVTAGVRGESDAATGVVGYGRWGGVYGAVIDNQGGMRAAATLGLRRIFGGEATFRALDAHGEAHIRGDLRVVGRKEFVEPHPSHPNQSIHYAALEGPESGTYYRGTAQTKGGYAIVQLPPHFQITTHEQGLTVQVTPHSLALVAVVSKDLTQIVVQADRDVGFDFFIQGVRRAYVDDDPIQTDFTFVPDSPQARLPAHFSDEHKARLIANGTYNPDGTVNMKTAVQLGWDQYWSKDRGVAK